MNNLQVEELESRVMPSGFSPPAGPSATRLAGTERTAARQSEESHSFGLAGNQLHVGPTANPAFNSWETRSGVGRSGNLSYDGRNQAGAIGLDGRAAQLQEVQTELPRGGIPSQGLIQIAVEIVVTEWIDRSGDSTGDTPRRIGDVPANTEQTSLIPVDQIANVTAASSIDAVAQAVLANRLTTPAGQQSVVLSAPLPMPRPAGWLEPFNTLVRPVTAGMAWPVPASVQAIGPRAGVQALLAKQGLGLIRPLSERELASLDLAMRRFLDALNEVAPALESIIPKTRWYAWFGAAIAILVAFETARRLVKRGEPAPEWPSPGRELTSGTEEQR